MHLKSLQLVGFKSFADRTRLELRPGVTVIVGPNGSGKSNLVDALSWVMGSQSTKALRTGKMDEVVFAGTATRPSLSRAEATLVIDNTERMLPLDLDEVALTRRLHRDGTSEYEINGVGCRLLDIQELLSDSGVGRHQHVIIGQGQIEEVLSASPEDHRAVIEEAAGVLKHRRRKERAERRLERTDEDVIRLQDLLGEIDRRLRPLRRQAKAAQAYHGLRQEVIALRLHLAGEALGRYREERTEAESELARLTQDLARDEEAVVALSQRLGGLSEEAEAVTRDLERDTGAAALLETAVERLRRTASVAHERARALTGRREAVEQRRSDLEAEAAEVEAEIAAVTEDQEAAAGRAESSEGRFRRLEEEERALSTQNALSPEGAVAAARGELSVLEAAVGRDDREVEAVGHRIEVITAQLGDEIEEISRINREIESIDRGVTKLEEAYERARDRSRSDQARWAEAESVLAEARLAVAAAEARAEAVRAALAGRFDIEARRAVEASEGAAGSLVSRLDIPPGLEKAVEAALGAWADAVVFSEPESLRRAVEELKRRGDGGIPTVVDRRPEPGSAGEAAAAPGVEALVDRLGETADRALAERLLGDVVLVEGWATAWSLVARHPALRAVTPEGDLISVHGVVAAHPDGAGPAMLESSEVDAERARFELSRAVSRHTAVRRDFEKSREAERVALEALEQAEAALSGKTEAMARIQKSVDALEGERARLQLRVSSLREGLEQRRSQIAALHRRLRDLEGEESQQMRAWQELEERRVAIASERELARSEWQDAASRLHGIVERKRLLEDRRERIRSELDRLDPERPLPDARSLRFVEETARRAVLVLTARLAELRGRQAGLREESGRVLGHLSRVREELEEKRAGVDRAKERTADLQLRLSELRRLTERVEEEVRRDADADPESALGAPRPDYGEEVDLEQLLAEKSAHLRRLGPINPLAAEEYAELSERHGFITDQLADVESSRAELRKVIRALEEEIEERFRAAFTEVAEAFQRYFALLFPGGKGRIRLADQDDPGSGLVIEAQPLGKKVSHLSLLSGGERSLAALAFLFAVFEARPSPFYVLDEVEAALDDSNLRRFLRLVDQFRGHAQLVIVTHQQQTMEAADVLYGVTMEPGSSSQVVRKDMTRVGMDLPA